MLKPERKNLNSRKQKKLLKKIVDIELGMFQKIRTIEPSLCQDLPESDYINTKLIEILLKSRLS